MANTKITELTQLTNPVSTDVLPIVDVGADVTKKISIADLLKNASAGTAAAPGIAFDGDNAGIYSPGADQLAFATNAAGRLFIDGSGRVGVNTATPERSFGVFTSTNDDGVQLRNTSTAASTLKNIRIQFSGTDTVGTIKTSGNIYCQPADQDFVGAHLSFWTRGSDITSEKMRLTSDGRLGIGLTSPSQSLEVAGNISLTANAGSFRTFGVPLSSDTTVVLRAGSSTGEGANIELGRDERMYIDATEHVLRSVSGASERLRIASDGKIGVGINSPAQLVHLRGASDSGFIGARIQNNNGATGLAGIEFSVDSTYAKAAIAQVRNSVNGRGDLVFYNDSNADTASWVAGDEKMRLTASGNLGINTATPGRPLHVQGIIRSAVSGSTADAAQGFEIMNNNAGPDGRVLMLSATDNGSAIIRNSSTTAAGIHFWIAGGEVARISDVGKLLVGTPSVYGISGLSSPDFQVNRQNQDATAAITCWKGDGTAFNPGIQFQRSYGNTSGTHTAVANGSYLGSLRFAGSDGAKFIRGAEIRAEADGAWSTDVAPGRLVFATTTSTASATPAERMRIRSNGTLLFNHTADAFPGIGNTNIGLTVEAAGSNASSVFISRDAIGLYLNRNSDGSVQEFRRSGTGVGTISVTTTATAYNTSSDYRLKENVVPLTGAVDRLNQLQVHRFNFIADPDKTVDGFIAHEAQVIVPESVTGIKDEVDENGDPVYQGIDQSKLVPLLTAALQEALAEIDSLKARVTALEA